MAAELLSVSPSPSRDQDVFGKELRLSGGRGGQVALLHNKPQCFGSWRSYASVVTL